MTAVQMVVVMVVVVALDGSRDADRRGKRQPCSQLSALHMATKHVENTWRQTHMATNTHHGRPHACRKHTSANAHRIIASFFLHNDMTLLRSALALRGLTERPHHNHNNNTCQHCLLGLETEIRSIAYVLNNYRFRGIKKVKQGFGTSSVKPFEAN